jgi:membrane protease YdiL (CAAX protease family)
VLLALDLRLAVALLARASGGDPADPMVNEILESLRRDHGLPAALLWAALLAPLTEEIAFRGVLLSAFESRISPRLANVAQAALFGLAHAHPILSPAFFGFGLVAGWMTRASGLLRPALVAHALNNAVACAALALSRAG